MRYKTWKKKKRKYRTTDESESRRDYGLHMKITASKFVNIVSRFVYCLDFMFKMIEYLKGNHVVVGGEYNQ